MTTGVIDALPEAFRCIRLERIDVNAQVNERDAYLLVAPLTGEGVLDAVTARAFYGACRVLRWRAGDDHEEGYLSPASDGTWRVRRELDLYSAPDEAGAKFGPERFVAGERVTLTEGECDCVYQVAWIKSL